MIVAFTGQKGGSGKTTGALSVASEWLGRGHKVLLVDADPQGSVLTWADVAGEAGLTAPTVVAMGANLHRPDQLPTLAQAYDRVVIDCPPNQVEIPRSALLVADLAILPVGPGALDAWSLAESIELVRKARSLRPELKVAILINRMDHRMRVARTAREVLADCGVPILAAELRYRATYIEAPAAGLGVPQYAPQSDAAQEVKTVVDEIEALLAEEVKDGVA